MPDARLAQSKLYMGCEYQGLICPYTLDVKGYEALARFKTHTGQVLPPNLVFEWLHEFPNLFEQVEYQAKCFQLSHAPNNYPLFVNLDPHAISTRACEPLIDAFNAHGDVTVELIENTCINDAALAQSLLAKLNRLNIQVALDDIGAPHSMLSLELLTQVPCIKFDKAWLTDKNLLVSNGGYQLETKHRALLMSLITFAKQTGKTTILEGVETQRQLELAKELGIDRVQGFLFKEQFIQTEIDNEVVIPAHARLSDNYLALVS